MQLKDPVHFGHWVFFIGGKDESDNPDKEIEELRIPSFGYAKSKKQLANLILLELNNLSGQGINGYLESLQEEARSYNKPLFPFLLELIEHQLCVRGGHRSGICWNTTWGDKFHSGVEKVDDMIGAKGTPKVIKKVYKVISKVVATPTVLGRVSSCRSCGGGRSLHISRNNRGRSGRI